MFFFFFFFWLRQSQEGLCHQLVGLALCNDCGYFRADRQTWHAGDNVVGLPRTYCSAVGRRPGAPATFGPLPSHPHSEAPRLRERQPRWLPSFAPPDGCNPPARRSVPISTRHFLCWSSQPNRLGRLSVRSCSNLKRQRRLGLRHNCSSCPYCRSLSIVFSYTTQTHRIKKELLLASNLDGSHIP